MTLDIIFFHSVILKVKQKLKKKCFIARQVIIMGGIIKGKKHAGSIILRATDEDSYTGDQLYT